MSNLLLTACKKILKNALPVGIMCNFIISQEMAITIYMKYRKIGNYPLPKKQGVRIRTGLGWLRIVTYNGL